MSDLNQIDDRLEDIEDKVADLRDGVHTSADGWFLLDEDGSIVAITTGDGWDYSVSDADFDRDADGNIILADFTDADT